MLKVRWTMVSIIIIRRLILKNNIIILEIISIDYVLIYIHVL